MADTGLEVVCLYQVLISFMYGLNTSVVSRRRSVSFSRVWIATRRRRLYLLFRPRIYMQEAVAVEIYR